MGAQSVAVAITVFRDPSRLATLLANMYACGVPDVPIRVFEDPSPHGDREAITEGYLNVCKMYNLQLLTAPHWSCMQGIIDYALRVTNEDWTIYVPDDVIFQTGGLQNEYSGILDYGRDFVGGIQAPYWNADELVKNGVIESVSDLYNGLGTLRVPRNSHWDGTGVPRKYINLNGAGFSISRRLYDVMGGWPTCTWRLDEWAGYQAWRHGLVCITLPGPPRIHLGGRGASKIGIQTDFHTVDAWKRATGGLAPEDTARITYSIMDKIKGDDWEAITKYYMCTEPEQLQLWE